MITIRKPAAWLNDTLDRLMAFDAGQCYVVRQFGAEAVPPEHEFSSSRQNCDSASYELFDDGSLLFNNNAEDVVHPSASDWAMENLTVFERLRWSEDAPGEGLIVDDMDKNLLTTLWGEEAARNHFAQCGGVI